MSLFSMMAVTIYVMAQLGRVHPKLCFWIERFRNA